MGLATDLAPAPETPARRNAVWLLVTLASLFAFPYFERINNPNENVRIWATRAIVERGVLDIDQQQAEWGYVNDKAKNDRHVYSGKAPGATFLGVPVLFAQTKLRHLAGQPSPGKREATFWLRLIAVKLPLAAFLFFFARHVERVTRSPAARDLLVVGLGLGTLLYPYGQIFVGHALAAAAAFGAYMLLAPPEGRDPRSFARSLALAGLLAGACVAFEYQAAIVAAVLSVYALRRYRARAWAFFAGALPPAVALGAFHTALFGRPWLFPFGNVENPEFLRTAHSAGFHGLSVPRLAAIGGSLFAPDYGLFVFSPFLALGALAALGLAARKPRREGLVLCAVAVLMVLFLGGMSNWRAGWCVGPRYITTVAPFLTFALARAWPFIAARRWLSAVVAGTVLASVVLNFVSGAVYPHYPEAFDNPFFDLMLPLLRQGYAPYSLGWLLGLRGLLSLAPLGLVALGALALGLGGGGDWRRRATQLAGAAAGAALLLGALSAYGRQPRPQEVSAAAFVRATWEPPRGR